MFYLDSNVFIYALEGSERYSEAVARLLERLGDPPTAVTSELTIGECLIGAASDELAALYLDVLSNEDVVRTIPVTRAIVEMGARHGRRSGVRLVDAIHIATAVSADCKVFVSNDLRLKVPQGLRKLDLRNLISDQ